MSKVKSPIIGVAIKREECLVGDEVLELREPGIRATHEIIELLFDDQFVAGLSKLGDVLKTREENTPIISWVTENMGVLMDIARGTLLPLVSRKSGDIAGIALDTNVNRKKLGMESDDLRAWVSEEISINQAVAIVVEAKNLIDLDDLAKKAKALLPTLLGTEESPESTTSTSVS